MFELVYRKEETQFFTFKFIADIEKNKLLYARGDFNGGEFFVFIFSTKYTFLEGSMELFEGRLQ